MGWLICDSLNYLFFIYSLGYLDRLAQFSHKAGLNGGLYEQ